MATETRNPNHNQTDRQRFGSVFDLPPNLFDSCRLLSDGSSSISQSGPFEISANTIDEETLNQIEDNKIKKIVPRWSCNTCKAEFESLLDQRSHFKSDHHRFNVKLNIAGKDTIKEEDFDELASDSLFEDYDISSISGSEDETEKSSLPGNDVHRRTGESVKRKLFIRLQTGEVVSLWKCLLLNETENLLFDNDKLDPEQNGGGKYFKENELVERLKSLVHEPRDKTQLRIVLLASGGHFAGCVFDGNSVVAHKTFHRYVVRAKAGKKQSTKDASGRAAHSAGASLRRYNELALKKEIQELLAAWKPYFDVSSCIFINAPSNSRQLLFSGEKPYFSDSRHIVRHVPVTVRRPTFKEAKRIYDHLTNMVYEVDEKGSSPSLKEELPLCTGNTGNCDLESNEEQLEQVDRLERKEVAQPCEVIENSDGLSESTENELIGITTPLHVAATSGNAQQTLELLEQGLDPCVKDERGRTPYMLATDKEVRNTFRRFMASNLDKWDWLAAKVPSPLTKEMEESQAAKQAEKDAKRKAKAKELKKLRKAKEKKAQAEAALPQNVPTTSKDQGAVPISVPKQLVQSIRGLSLSKEEELKRAQAAEREKRAAAAEKRLAAAAALNAQGTSQTAAPTNPAANNGTSDGIYCSCCNVSLAGKVPFHRYHYKYCSTSCMHVHREMLEDG
ncbi:Ankyrin repeat [Macleaya cordata]|uniref:Ankyrin repeat n=1 Tax=Macleaya cordata TaxID=56857 RepID=A0A200QB56_MACCD|nr:Ankyrin repeat [Macleaya cordata]